MTSFRPLLLLAFVLAAGQAVWAETYAISGTDGRLGAFTGALDVTERREGFLNTKTRYTLTQTMRFASGQTETISGRDGKREDGKIRAVVRSSAGAASVLAAAINATGAATSTEGLLEFQVDGQGGAWTSTLTFGDLRATATGSRPTLTRGATGYEEFQGVPFVKGADDPLDIHVSDPRQGYLGNCYMIASMIALAQRRPESIRGLIVDQGDGTWDVKLGGQSYRLEQSFPTRGDQAPIFSKLADKEELERDGKKVTRWETWPMMLERAFAQRAGSYAGIENDWPRVVFREVSGPSTQLFDARSLGVEAFAAGLREGVRAGKPVCVSFVSGVGDFGGDLHDEHSYVVMAEEDGKFRLYNPWGSSHPSRTFTAAELHGIGGVVDVGQ
jgi:hypothetical protein